MIASGQYYKAMADGDTVQAFLFMEAALGIFMSCVCTTSILLVYHACRCDGPGSPRKRVPRQAKVSLDTVGSLFGVDYSALYRTKHDITDRTGHDSRNVESTKVHSALN